MKPREIASGIRSVGAIDWDRRLFDELIPLPDGTSYNSYLVQGSDKTALIDGVDPSKRDVLMAHLSELSVQRLDYLVANHAEQDHSGAIPDVLARYPEATVVATPKCRDMLVDLLLLPADRIKVVEDGEVLSLGDRTLEFIHAPMVHWPETMLTYLREKKVLFPCDLFGSHLATSDLYVVERERVYEAAKRYYAEIMMPFSAMIQKHLERLGGYPIDTIAPSHGPIYDDPQFIMGAYRAWVNDPPRNTVVLPYVSMHRSTGKMVEYLVGSLMDRGVGVQQFDLSVTNVGKLAMSLVDAATLIIGTPTVLVGPHPKVAYAAVLANALRPKLHFLSVIGSYGWGTKALDQLKGMVPNLRVEILDPVITKGYPRDDDFQALDRLADTVAERHNKEGLQ